MERTVHELSRRVPRPKKVPFHGGFVFRYIEKTIHQPRWDRWCSALWQHHRAEAKRRMREEDVADF